MFIGHYAPAFVAAAAGQRAPALGVMFVAAQLVDIAFFSLAMLDIEHFRLVPGATPQTSLDLYHLPYTHSLLGTIAFAAFWAAAARALGQDWRLTALGAAVVMSHWPIDLLVHLPDLTIAGGQPKLGFGLWATPWIARPLELALAFGAMAWFVFRTRGRGCTIFPILALATAMLTAQAVDWFGPLPYRIVDPVPASIPLTALAAFVVLALLARWFGRTRMGTGPVVTRL